MVLAAVVLLSASVVVCTVLPATNSYLYWFQAFVMGRTDESRSMVLLPPAGFTGTWRTYHVNLTIDSEMDFVDGKVTGTWRRHDPHSGNIWWSGEYAGNVAVGNWVWYDASGTIRLQDKGGGYYEPITEQPLMLFWIVLGHERDR